MNTYFNSLTSTQLETIPIKEIETNMANTNAKKYYFHFISLPVFMRSSFPGNIFSLMILGLAIPFFTAGTPGKKPVNLLQNTQWSRCYVNPEGCETDAFIQFTADKLYIWEKQKNYSCYDLNVIRYKTEDDKFYYWNNENSGWASDELFIKENDRLIFLRKEITGDKTIFTKDEFNAAGWCVCK